MMSERVLQWAIAQLSTGEIATLVSEVGGRIAAYSDGEESLPSQPGIYVQCIDEAALHEFAEGCELHVYILWPTKRSEADLIATRVRNVIDFTPGSSRGYTVTPSTKSLRLNRCRYIGAVPTGRVATKPNAMMATLLRFGVSGSEIA